MIFLHVLQEFDLISYLESILHLSTKLIKNSNTDYLMSMQLNVGFKF